MRTPFRAEQFFERLPPLQRGCLAVATCPNDRGRVGGGAGGGRDDTGESMDELVARRAVALDGNCLSPAVLPHNQPPRDGVWRVVYRPRGSFHWMGARGRILHNPPRDWLGVAGLALALHALAFYPLIGSALGHRFPVAPTFGAPCPTSILTLGLLVWAKPPWPARVLIIPTLWAVLSTTAIVEFGMFEDAGLAVAAAVSLFSTWARPRRNRETIPLVMVSRR